MAATSFVIASPSAVSIAPLAAALQNEMNESNTVVATTTFTALED
jgi:hypothetical protein